MDFSEVFASPSGLEANAIRLDDFYFVGWEICFPVSTYLKRLGLGWSNENVFPILPLNEHVQQAMTLWRPSLLGWRPLLLGWVGCGHGHQGWSDLDSDELPTQKDEEVDQDVLVEKGSLDVLNGVQGILQKTYLGRAKEKESKKTV